MIKSAIYTSTLSLSYFQHAKLPTVIEVEEKGQLAITTSQDKELELVDLEPKEMTLSDPLDTIFALAYKNLEPGVS